MTGRQFFSEIGWRGERRAAKVIVMTVTARKTAQRSAPDLSAHVDALDWPEITGELDTKGCAFLKGLLTPDQCREIAALYPDDVHFRSRIVMGRHGFGRGEYKYFSYPLPDQIAQLRPALYGHLQSVANRWNEAMAIDIRYPD